MQLTNKELMDIVNSSDDEVVDQTQYKTKLKYFIEKYEVTTDIDGKIPFYVLYYIYNNIFRHWSNKGKRRLSRYQFVRDMKQMYPTRRTNRYRAFCVTINIDWSEYEAPAREVSEQWLKDRKRNTQR
jgi:hypothetical protein